MLQCNQLADFTNRAWQEQESGGTWDSQNLPGLLAPWKMDALP